MAKKLKKRTRKHRRVQRARTKLTLAAILGMIDATQQAAAEGLTFSRKRGQEQIFKVRRWLEECWPTLGDLGRASLSQAIQKVRDVDGLVVADFFEGGKPKDLEGHAAIWIMLGMLIDDARAHAPDTNRRAWNFLASTVNTWTGMLLENVDADRAEDIGGRMAERAWQVLLDKPGGYFGSLKEAS